VSGIALLAASILAGALWDQFGPSGTFFGGALVTAIALASLSLTRKRGF